MMNQAVAEFRPICNTQRTRWNKLWAPARMMPPQHRDVRVYQVETW